jgi:anti-anti-sigma factor
MLSLQCAAAIATSGTVRVAITGNIDFVTADQLQMGLLGLLERVPASLLDLDLSVVDFCDCAGLAALMAVHDAAAQLGCGLVISAAAPGTAWLLASTGMGVRFNYPPSSVEHEGALVHQINAAPSQRPRPPRGPTAGSSSRKPGYRT